MIKIIEGDKSGSFKQQLLERIQLNYSNNQSKVNDIIDDIRQNKDIALFKYTKLFDKVDITKKNIKVTEKEIEEAYELVDDNLVRVVRRAKDNIYNYHQKQRRSSWFDVEQGDCILGQKITPIEKVGIYVPGGKAVYPSSVLMNALPAMVAGVKKIVMVTPPRRDGSIDPLILVAAQEAGVSEIYKIGGAQAIAALAYGTESVTKVDKIVGPGNIYVALAKKAVYGQVNIDSIAGPSEILVIADETCNPKYVAADLLSQAEHDEMASAVLVTTSECVAKEVQKQVIEQTARLSRKSIIEQSLNDFGAIFVVDDIKQAVQLANEYAPEHLELCVKDAMGIMPLINNAGAIFIGNYSPEPLGDYMAGPNHVLPTCGTARFFSPLSVDDFIKKSSIISYTKQSLELLKDDIICFAEAEQLTAHANSIKVRFDDDE